MKIHKLRIDEKDVFISQRQGLFKVVKPLRNEDGTLNWFNILTGGSWFNLLLVSFLVMVISIAIIEVVSNISVLQESLDVCRNTKIRL